MRKSRIVLLNFLLFFVLSISVSAQVSIRGELQTWHRVTLQIEGPEASESGIPNPFSDYKLTGIFTQNGSTYIIPGYFAADGNAANTSAKSGNIWRIHFAPPSTGEWNYEIRFRKGDDIAITDAIDAGEAVVDLDEITGSFSVTETDKSGKDLRGKGKLEYVGEHHLQFAGNGEWFLKAGADSPENLLDYADFDDTPDLKKWQKTWSPHLQDWSNGDPTWKDGKGKGLIGAVNYLSSRGANSISFLTMAVNGDDRSVFPWDNVNSRDKFDCSKLDQWEIVFTHAETKGMYLHFKTSETENETLLNGGDLGRERKLYYRELIARFAHHNALNWNMGEENGLDFKNKTTGAYNPGQTTAQQQACIAYFKDNDPYQNNIVLHTAPGLGNQKNQYNNLIGNKSELTGLSLQTEWDHVFGDTKHWITESAKAGKKWVVANDEQGHAQLGVPHDDYTGSPNLHDIRKKTLWGNFMAGGAGVEYYFGYGDKIGGSVHDDLIFNSSDMRGEDFRTREKSWRYAKVALDFFNQYVPFWETVNDNSLTSVGQCLYLKDKIYVIYLQNGGNPKVTLGSGVYDVKWYNPRVGGELIIGETGIDGGASVEIGASPNTSNDWVALIQKQGYSHPKLPNAEITGVNEVIDIELSDKSISLEEIYDGYQLTADIYPASAIDKSVTWETSDRYVATVSSNGMVRARGKGSCTITATTNDGGFVAKCKVSVGRKSGKSITYGDNFIVFEAEATNSDLDLWVMRTPADSKYREGTRGVGPINETYIEFTGNDFNGGPATSPLEYKFTAPKTAEYQLTMRMLQNLEGAEWDKCNDVWIKLSGNFSPGSTSATKSMLTSYNKFYGRGKDNWGSMVQFDVNHTKYATRYNLIEGEEYTLTVAGRAQRTCIDYILFFERSLGLKFGEEVDVCTQNPEEYRPKIVTSCGDPLIYKSYTDFPNINISGFKPAYKDNGNECLAINAVNYKGDFAAATTTFEGETGIYDIQINTLTETDGESSYNVKVNGKLIGTFQNPETETDYAPASEVWSGISVKNGDVIQVEFNSHTNGKIPEGNTTAYSRGRWDNITFIPVCDGVQIPHVFVDSVVVKNQDVELAVGEQFTVEAVVYPEEATNLSIVTSTSDSSIVSIDGDVVKALKPGVVALKIASQENSLLSKVIVVKVVQPTIGEGLVPMIKYDRSGMKAIYASSENQHQASATHLKEHTLDGDPLTKWHTEWNPETKVHPHEIWYDLGEELLLDQIDLLPRDEGQNGMIKGYKVYVSNDTTNWGEPHQVGSIVYPDSPSEEDLRMMRSIIFNTTAKGRYLRLVATSEIAGGAWASLAEIYFNAFVTGIEISESNKTVDLGDAFMLDATVNPINDQNLFPVTWESTNSSIADVDENGNITTGSGGFAYITASILDGYYTDSCLVAVAASGTNAIGILSDTATVFKDSTIILSAITLPANETVTWESLQPQVATITANGEVYGVETGQAKIVASIQSGGLTDTSIVNVVAPYFTIAQDTVKLRVGEAFDLQTSVGPQSALVSWESSDATIARVSSAVVVAKSEGVVTISGSTFNGTYTDKVIVEVVQPQIVLSAQKVSAFANDTIQLIATATPESEVVWTSSTPAIATVNDSGEVLTLEPGRTLIQASANGYSALCEVFVAQNAELNKKKTTIELNHTKEIFSTLAPDGYDEVWTSTNQTVATVNEGAITAISVGETEVIIAFVLNGEVISSDTCLVTVEITPPEVVFEEHTKVIFLSEVHSLIAKATPDSFRVDLRSENEAIATIAANGELLPVAEGKTAIIVEMFDENNEVISADTCNVEVRVPVVNISLSKKTINVGDQYELNVSKPSSFTVYWSSDDKSIATVSSSGVVKGRSAGVTDITAEIKDGDGNVLSTDVCTITVDKKNGVQTIDKNDDIMLYPNPTNGVLKCSSEEVKEILIFDNSGRMIIQRSVENNDTPCIDISNMNDGLFYVTLNLRNGRVISQTIMKR